MSYRKILPILVGVAVLAPGQADAQTKIWNACGGSTFNTCAAVALSVTTPASAPPNTQAVSVQIWNLAGLYGTAQNTVIETIAFLNMGYVIPEVTNPVPPTAPTTGSGSYIGTVLPWDVLALPSTLVAPTGESAVWTLAPDVNSFNHGIINDCAPPLARDGALAGDEVPPLLPITNLWTNPCVVDAPDSEGFPTLASTGWVTFTFDVFGFDPWDVASTEMQLGFANMATNVQSICSTSSVDLGNPGFNGVNCGDPSVYLPPPPTVVPEPGTVILMGTGLLGMALVMRRRRRDDGIEV